MKRFDTEARAALVLVTLAAATAVALAASGIASGKAERSFAAKIQQRVLVVDGSAADSTLAFRLAEGKPAELEVDVGDDGTVDRQFSRKLFGTIVVHTGAGDDTVLVDESNGEFTGTKRMIVYGGAGNDVLEARTGGADDVELTLDGGPGDDVLVGGSRDDILDGGAGDDLLIGVLGADRLTCGPGHDRAVGDEADTVAADCNLASRR